MSEEQPRVVENPFGIPLRDDNPSAVDLIGLDEVVAAVASTATRPDLDPITLGIHAPWGGGKTTVLELLRERLEQRGDVLVTYVSPWEYDTTVDPKAALIDAVLGRLQRVAEKERSGWDHVAERLKKLRRRVRLAKAVKLAAKSALTASLPSIDSLTSLFEEDDGQAADPTLQGFRAQFAELLGMDELKGIGRVVVLVDDLDRAFPEAVVESLEAIKLFLSVKKMAFVIAADENNVARAIGRRLESSGQPITAHQYLEKIVQIPFRVPALSLERTEEYLALLMLADAEDAGNIRGQLDERRREGPSTLAKRFDGLCKTDSSQAIQLAEDLAPVLHRATQGNPRRLKRFLNAYWLRGALASARGINLEPRAYAKLMLVELLFPEVFAQLLTWLADGSLQTRVAEIEAGEGDHAAQVYEWGRIDPPLAEIALDNYLHLAATLRGEIVSEAALAPRLRELLSELTAGGEAGFRRASTSLRELEPAEKAAMGRHAAAELRRQVDPDRQKALARALSVLADEGTPARTIAEELRLMDPRSVRAPVPYMLVSEQAPAVIKELVKGWSKDPDMPEATRKAAVDAIGQDER